MCPIYNKVSYNIHHQIFKAMRFWYGLSLHDVVDDSPRSHFADVNLDGNETIIIINTW
jgi:hypothetical protein